MHVVPEVQQAELRQGPHYSISDGSRIVCAPELRADAEMLAEDLGSAGIRVAIADKPAGVGDIALGLGYDGPGYELRVGDQVEIVGADADAVWHGTRTFLQLLLADGEVRPVVIRDWADYPDRGLLIDTIPRTYSRDWWTALVRELSWLKYNQLTILIGGLAPEGRDLMWLDQLCRRHHIDLVTDLAMPSHCDGPLAAHPGYALAPGSKDPLQAAAFDFTRPGALDVLQAEVEQRIDALSGPYWHMGADEYLSFPEHPRKWDAFPQLAEFARTRTGSVDATGADAYVWLINWMAGLVRSHGKILRIWNDHLDHGVVPLDPEVIVEHWYQPVAPTAMTAGDIARTNRLVNCHEGLTYYDNGWRQLDARAIFEEFDPHVFQGGERVGDAVVGAHLNVWMPTGGRAGDVVETNEELAANLWLPLRAMAAVTWHRAGTWDELSVALDHVGSPPGNRP